MCFGSFRAQNLILKHPVAYFWRKSQKWYFPCQKCHFLAKFSFIFWLPGELWEGLQRFIVVFGSFYYRNRILHVKVDLKPTGFVLKMFLCCPGWSKTFLPPPLVRNYNNLVHMVPECPKNTPGYLTSISKKSAKNFFFFFFFF